MHSILAAQGKRFAFYNYEDNTNRSSLPSVSTHYCIQQQKVWFLAC